MTDEQESLSVTIREYGEDVVTLRQVGLGIQPLLLIEPVEDADGNVNFELSASLIETDELADVLDLVLEVLRNGT